MNGLLDLVQSASNTAADTVAGPVDLISWALRKAGVPVPDDAVGGSEWMKKKGLKKDVQQSPASLAGETLGLISPIVAAAKAPQIAAGLIKAGENAAAPSTLPRMSERGAFLWHGSPDTLERLAPSTVPQSDFAKVHGHKLAASERLAGKDARALMNERITDKFWPTVEPMVDETYLGVRADTADIASKFRDSWNRPDGKKTTKLPGLSVIGAGYADGVGWHELHKAVDAARMYGPKVYLVKGDYDPAIQHLANDPGEVLLQANKVLGKFDASGERVYKVGVDDALLSKLLPGEAPAGSSSELSDVVKRLGIDPRLSVIQAYEQAAKKVGSKQEASKLFADSGVLGLRLGGESPGNYILPGREGLLDILESFPTISANPRR